MLPVCGHWCGELYQFILIQESSRMLRRLSSLVIAMVSGGGPIILSPMRCGTPLVLGCEIHSHVLLMRCVGAG